MTCQPVVQAVGRIGQLVEYRPRRHGGRLQGGLEDQPMVGGAGDELPGDPLVQQPYPANIAAGGHGDGRLSSPPGVVDLLLDKGPAQQGLFFDPLSVQRDIRPDGGA